MFTKTVLAAGALLSMAAAVPLQQQNKRDVVWETRTHWDVTTMHVTTTVWLGPGETAPAESSPVAQSAPAHFGHGHHHKHTSTIQNTVTVPAATPSPPIASAPPPAQSPSSPYVAPSPSTPAAAPTTTQAPSPPPAQPQPTHTGGGGGAPSGQTYTGDITHYDVGLGSCGWTNNDSEAVVAIPVGMMGTYANPNANPLCGKTITISYAGQEHTAKVVDTCGGCEGASIDLSPTLFTAVAPNGDGRVHGVKWWYNN